MQFRYAMYMQWWLLEFGHDKFIILILRIKVYCSQASDETDLRNQ